MFVVKYAWEIQSSAKLLYCRSSWGHGPSYVPGLRNAQQAPIPHIPSSSPQKVVGTWLP